MHVSTKLLALISFIVVFALQLSTCITCIITDNFGIITSVLLVYSASLIIFPIMTVPLVADIMLKVKEQLGKQGTPNPRLVKDYVDGCFTAFLLAVLELMIILVLSLFRDGILPSILMLLLLPMATSMTALLVSIMLSLWKVAKLAYEVLTS